MVCRASLFFIFKTKWRRRISKCESNSNMQYAVMWGLCASVSADPCVFGAMLDGRIDTRDSSGSLTSIRHSWLMNHERCTQSIYYLSGILWTFAASISRPSPRMYVCRCVCDFLCTCIFIVSTQITTNSSSQMLHCSLTLFFIAHCIPTPFNVAFDSPLESCVIFLFVAQ